MVRYNPDTEEYLWDTKDHLGDFDLVDQKEFLEYMQLKEAYYTQYGKTIAFIETHQ